ncbi:MAG TPA: folylpolyglutamate synthase/dihydrofolate synthase family protein [Flavobacteriales bacterium]|nr:folylpolyglutamate synthase/dihydrofolate synthase family protein [Flavobacteriales bacterium]
MVKKKQILSYKQAIDFLYSQTPVFHKIGAAAYKPGLQNTYALAKACGNPHIGLKCIHVAGTNGKGSTSHILASVFYELGWRTGLYTSPHLKDFRERIKINGKPIDTKYVVDFVKKHATDIARIQPSFFELTCVMALRYFGDKKVDIAIVETGLGGRLDSTNIVFPDLSVITNISKDHMQFLGNTLEKIAFEKAGIIKPGIPVVVGEAKGRVKKVFQKAAEQNESPLFFADKLKPPANLKSELKGTYQPKNFRTVLKSVEVLNQSGYSIPQKTVLRGIEKVVTNTALMGRWQTVAKNPYIIADIGHNEAGIKEVVKNLRQEKYTTLHIVLGFANDKDLEAILKLLPKKAMYYFTNANTNRALPATVLQQHAAKFKLKGNAWLSVKKALGEAKKRYKTGDLIFVGGSNFVVAEIL